jgi:hypothetical protein
MRKYTVVKFNTHPNKGVEFFKRMVETNEIGIYTHRDHAIKACINLRIRDLDHLYLVRELDLILMDGLEPAKIILGYLHF